jgi:hypothetical protein
VTIGEVARKAGLQASAIRYYERLGLLPRPARIGGRRSYDRVNPRLPRPGRIRASCWVHDAGGAGVVRPGRRWEAHFETLARAREDQTAGD